MAAKKILNPIDVDGTVKASQATVPGEAVVLGSNGYIPLELINATKADIGLGNVDNTADANKSVASAAKLTTARTIGLSGVTATAQSFNGTADITIPVSAVPTSLLSGSIAQSMVTNLSTDLAGKQATLVGSGTGQNIKTINSTSLLGTGDIAIPVITVDSSLSSSSTNPVQNKVVDSAISTINGKIPSEASSSNQLADKSFVNSSIATATANFKGTFNVAGTGSDGLGLTTSATHSQVETALASKVTGATNNDYTFVYYDYSTDSGNIDKYERYKYNGTSWEYEYTLNNSSFTAQQWATINTTLGTAATCNTGTSNGNVPVVGSNGLISVGTSGNAATATSSTDSTYASKIGTNSSHPAVGSSSNPVYVSSSGVVTACSVGAISSGDTGIPTGGTVYTAVNAKETAGYITINGTAYQVVVSSTDAGTAGKITFVVES